MATFKPLSRAQLAKICPDEESIRFFEKLFRQAGTDTPEETDAATNDAAMALAGVASVRQQLERIASAIELAAPPKPQEQDKFIPALLTRLRRDADLMAPPAKPARRKCYGAFSCSTTLTASAINTAEAVTFDTASIAKGVCIGSVTSRIYVYEPGAYNFQFSAQLDKTNSSAASVYIWCAINGTDVADSTGKITAKDNASESVAAWNYVLDMAAGDYFELMWEVDDVDLVLHAEASTAVHPAIPSVILTVTDSISS